MDGMCDFVIDTGNSCDDMNPCTSDTCNGMGTCVGTPIPVLAVNNTVMGTKSAQGATDVSVSWTDAPGPFNVYRGLHQHTRLCSGGPNNGLPCSHPSQCPLGQCEKTTAWTYNQTCFANMTASPVSDLALPPADTTFYYLVTRKSMCGESSLGEGRDENGMPTPRPNSNPCP
jgi:hypothetical protein